VSSTWVFHDFWAHSPSRQQEGFRSRTGHGFSLIQSENAAAFQTRSTKGETEIADVGVQDRVGANDKLLDEGGAFIRIGECCEESAALMDFKQ
jgi:hypothetical protein